jgi:hypothetical protein
MQRDLVALAIEGDDEAFTTLVELHLMARSGSQKLNLVWGESLVPRRDGE